MRNVDEKGSVGSYVSHWKEDETSHIMEGDREKSKTRKTLLLHSCCGPCSTSVVERLDADYHITIYFYNPNITDEEEYYRRLDAQRKFIRQYNESPDRRGLLGFMEGGYDSREFCRATKGMEGEKEGGRRCVECFRLRLEKTAGQAKILGYDCFSTTLTVSPHKSYETVSHIGRQLSYRYGVDFLDMDFKKKDGYKRSVELSKLHRLYRQDYCGCHFSFMERNAVAEEKRDMESKDEDRE